MRLKALLLNPWVYDFSAFNLWARPLGLLKVAGYLSAYDVEIGFLDLMDVYAKKGPFGTGKYPRQIVPKPPLLKDVPRYFARYGAPEEKLEKALKSGGHDMVFITCAMPWWYPGVARAVEIIRELRGNVPVILGGIYPTLWPEHATRHSGADFIYEGPVGDGLRAALRTFGFRAREIRQGERIPYYGFGYHGGDFAPILTGEGCPFRCPYCATAFLSKGVFYRRPPDEVVREVAGLSAGGVRNFAFYDDALLWKADEHIKPILKEIINRNIRADFHAPNGLHARFLDGELADLMRKAGFKTIRVSFETVDPERQGLSGKVSSEELKEAVGLLEKAGFHRASLGVYLMYGLPGQPLEEVEEGARFLKALGVRVHLSEFAPAPGTPCWDSLLSSGVIREDIDPLLTNNSVFTPLFAGYEPRRLEALRLGVKRHNQHLRA